MWVFDGEEWTQDDGSIGGSSKPETARPRYEETMPELQVLELEIVPVSPTKQTPIVPFPLP